MLTALLLAALAQTPQHRLFLQPNMPRGERAYFEAFGTDGVGATGVCSTTAPTGAKGETLTFTRATAATCTKGTNGTRSTGIADGDLVLLASGQMRQEIDADGYLGPRTEIAATNLLLRYIEYENAAWADVGTPSLTGSQTDPFGTTTAVLFTDNDGAAFEGRSQAVTVSAGAAHTMHCYVKAGTATEARISLDGTTGDIASLSASTWSIVTATDASSSGTSISAQVLVGDAAGDTGTVIFGGCQVETGSWRTSIIPTTSATVTRNLETLSVTLAVAMSASTGSHAISVTYASIQTSGFSHLMRYGAEALILYVYFPGTNLIRVNDGSAEVGAATGAAVVGTSYRYWSSYGATVLSVASSTATNTGVFDGTMGTAALTTLSFCGATTTAPNGICTRICADPSATRCR